MRTYHHNGEYWYCDRRGIIGRARRWLVSFGMWESPTREGKRLNPLWHHWGGRHWWQRLGPPWPLGFLGHRLTIFSWGLQAHWGHTYLVLTWRPREDRYRCYLSRDGTPDGATTWLLGTPRAVRRAAESRRRDA